MSEIILPHNWTPRDYQKPALNAWIRDGFNHLELIWHRRAGKDDVCLHGTAIKAHERVANYWHMLPQHNQVRKAIWTAVNSHTGQRRIDEAFPKELRESTNETEMFIKFKNGSTWQCLGSDNFQGAIGSAPAGIVFSEWSLSNPSASGYLRPILKENNGWQLKIGTPRGKNHAYRTYKAAKKSKKQFAELLTVEDTGMDKVWNMQDELDQYIAEFGDDLGRALFLQEYYCSFEAAVVGAVWGAELSKLERDKRLCVCEHDPRYKVFTAWDIGRKDATAIWFYQVIANEIHIIDYEEDTLKNPDYFVSRLLGQNITIDLIDDDVKVTQGELLSEFEYRRAYDYEIHWLPHDARAKTFAAKGKSIHEQLSKAFGWDKVRITPNLSKQDQITAARKAINKMVIDWKAEKGFEAVKQYRYEQDEKNNKLKDTPLHDWTSHAADALMYVAVSYQTVAPPPPKPETKLKNAMAMDNGIAMEDMFEL